MNNSRRIFEVLSVEYFNHAGYYTIVLTERVEEPEELIKSILTDLWSLHIINVNILSFKSFESGSYIFTFFPYSENYCDQVQPVLWDYFADGNFTMNKEIFATKLDNFYGCPITLGAYDFPPYIILTQFPNGTTSPITDGIEGILFRVLSQKMNFRTQIVHLMSGTYLSSEQYFDLVGLLSAPSSNMNLFTFHVSISARKKRSKCDRERDSKYDRTIGTFHPDISPLPHPDRDHECASHSVHID